MGESKLRVLFVGDMVVETGFSTVMHNIIKYNEEHFDIVGLGVNYKGDPHPYNFPIYPASTGGNLYGLDRVCNILNAMDFDVVFILNDAWVISYYLDAIKKNVKKQLPKIIVYFPVDSRYHDKSWYRDFDIVSAAYTYTEFGKKVVNDPDCAPDLQLGVMPHGISSEDFYKISDDRVEVRKKLFGNKLTPGFGSLRDLFIVLNANRNQPRKRLDITIAGFSLFAKDKPSNIRLYMHCGVRDASVDVIKEAKRYHIDDKLIFTNLNTGIQRISKERLNLIYNACDVGINTSLGEGWGLINVEHAVTGAVQIVPRHSSCAELFGDCGLMMETIADWTFDQSETVGRLTNPEEVARCLDILYKNRELKRELSQKGLEKFTSPEYEWKNIAENWRKIFIEAENVVTVPEQY